MDRPGTVGGEGAKPGLVFLLLLPFLLCRYPVIGRNRHFMLVLVRSAGREGLHQGLGGILVGVGGVLVGPSRPGFYKGFRDLLS